MDKSIKSIRKLAIDDIYRIGTPDAAIKLVPFLWDEDEDFAIYVAWHLGVLLKNPEVEEKLSKYPLKPEQTPVDELTYIWRPFENNSDSALFTITSRLAYLIKVSSDENIPQPVLPVDPRIIIPISAIETPNKFNKIEVQERGNYIQTNIKFLSLSFYPELKQVLFNRLLHSRTPTRNDWIKLYAKDVNYNFHKSWNYYTVFGISIILSVITTIELLTIIIRNPGDLITWIIASPFYLVLILCFWLIIWYGMEKKLEPKLFTAFGLLGIITFCQELKRLWIYKSVWPGIHYLCNSIAKFEVWTGNMAATWPVVGILMTFIGPFIGILVGQGILTGLILQISVAIIVGSVAGILPSTILDTNPTKTSNDITLTIIITLIKILFIGTMMGIIVGTIVGTIIGIVLNVGGIAFAPIRGTWIAMILTQIIGRGLGFWYRAKDKRDWGRYLAIFAFPFFCTFPIVLGYSSYAFYDWFGLTWQQITIIWIGILGVCTVLWQWGQKLDYEARNPFKGILDSVKDEGDIF